MDNPRAVMVRMSPEPSRSDEEFVYVVIDIPLKELRNRFDLYRVVQFPGLVDGQKISWELSSPYIAISQDRERSVLLSDVDAQICKHGLCKPNVVQTSYIYQQDCEVSLFKNDSEAVWKSCDTIVTNLSRGPKVEWKFDNTWLAESCVGEKYHVICGSLLRPTQGIQGREIRYVLEKITLPSNCWLRGRLFTTPKMLTPLTSVEIKTNLSFAIEAFPKLKSKVEDRKEYKLLKPNRIPINPSIDDVTGDIDSTRTELGNVDDSYVEMGMGSGSVSPWTWMAPLVAVAGVVVIGAVFFCYVKRCGGLMSFQENSGPREVSNRRLPVEARTTEMVPLNIISPTYAQGMSVSGPIEPYAYATLAEVGRQAETDLSLVGPVASGSLPSRCPQGKPTLPPPSPISNSLEAELPPPETLVTEYLEPSYIPMTQETVT